MDDEEDISAMVCKESRLGLYNNKKKNRTQIAKARDLARQRPSATCTAVHDAGCRRSCFFAMHRRHFNAAIPCPLQKKRASKMLRLTKVKKARKHGLMNVKMDVG